MRALRFSLSAVRTHLVNLKVQVLVFFYLLKAQLLNTKGSTVINVGVNSHTYSFQFRSSLHSCDSVLIKGTWLSQIPISSCPISNIDIVHQFEVLLARRPRVALNILHFMSK